MDVVGTPRTRARLIAGALIAGGLLVLYSGVVAGLVRAWGTDDNYSHGYLIPLIAAYLARQRRRQFVAAARAPSAFGLAVIAISLLAVTAGAGEFLQRISLVSASAGVVLFLFGWPRLRTVAFPLAVLLLMIPLPAAVIQQIEYPMQIITSQLSEAMIRAFGIPVLRDGNLLALTNVTLRVAEECSGIRSVLSLLTLGLVFGYVPDSRLWPRIAVAVLTIPVVLLSNGIRVAVTGIATHYYGRTAAEGLFHDVCGWLAFAAAFVMMLLVNRLLLLISPDRKTSATTPTAAPAGA